MSSGQSTAGSLFQNPGDLRGGLVSQASPIDNKGQLAGTINNYLGAGPPGFRSNIPSRRNLPFVGRDGLLESIRASLADPSSGRVVVLHGPPGVGKSELAREYARRNCETYTGGTFIVEAGKRAIVVDLARLGQTLLSLDYPPGMALEDQCLRALSALGITPRLLIYDNVQAEDAVIPWLPPSGVPCDVLMTTTLDRWDSEWTAIEIPALSPADSTDLIERIAGKEVSARFGAQLTQLAGGLPVQIVPAAAALAYERKRGRLESAVLTIAQETQESFLGVYGKLETSSQLLLHAGARLNPRRIRRGELENHLAQAMGWDSTRFRCSLDACLDLQVLQDGDELRMHQLFAAFLLDMSIAEDLRTDLKQVACVQARRVTELAGELAEHPTRADLAAALLTFPLDPQQWANRGVEISVPDGETIGQALYEIGSFMTSRPWYERAVAQKEQGDVHGRVDHESLGTSLHQVGLCLSSTGEFAAARPWYERAVAQKEQGDVHGRVDHQSLGVSLHCVGYCLSSMGEFAAGRPWYERAVAQKEQGDVHGRVNHESVGVSLRVVANCLSQLGRDDDAKPSLARAAQLDS
jgi:hypothetical protein